MRRQRSTHLLMVGQLLTALPSLVYWNSQAPIWAMIAAAIVRGLGFGLTIVVSVALLSEVATPTRRGAWIGAYSLALSVPGVIVPTTGLFLFASGRAQIVAFIAFASGLAGFVCASRIDDPPKPLAWRPTNLLTAVRRPVIFLVFAGFVLASCGFGAVVTYAPIGLPLIGIGSAGSFLLVSGAARAASRWLVGVLSHVQPPHAILAAGAVLSSGGLFALAVNASAGTVLAAAVAYGIGYGAIQTAAFLAMSERGTDSDSGAVSALWGAGTDLGSSIGGVLIGLAAANFGFLAAVWVMPITMAVSLPLFLRSGQSANAEIAAAKTR
jgi:predicted MFS family arabinose efflux permease